MYETQLPGYTIWSTGTSGFWTWSQNGIPVVTTPKDVDAVNEHLLYQKLVSAAVGSPVVVVDSGKTFFAVTSMHILDEVGRMMADTGGELRVVITKPRWLEVLNLLRCDRNLRTFSNLIEALRVPQGLRVPQQDWASQPQAA
jgi:hypothetical protein